MDRRLQIFALFLLLAASQAFGLGFERYHSQEEINNYMREIASAYPDLVRHHHLGYSARGREINYITISRGDPDMLPGIYLNGTHHGNEKSSTEGILAVIDHLIDYRNTPEITELLESYVIFLQPLVNPDGHAAGSRTDAIGRDPNRDYSYPERSEADSYKLPEIRLVKELTDRHKFRAAVAWHSGMEAVLWPWCHTSQRTNDQDVFYTISRMAAQAMGMSRYVQSYFDYRTSGEFIDYVYMAHGTLALTFEVSSDPAPPPARLAATVARSTRGALAFLRAILELDRGTLPIEPSGDQLLAMRGNGLPATRVE